MDNKMTNVLVRSNLPVNDYKSVYQAVRSILCDAETFSSVNEETIEKCMWISAIADTMNEVPMNALRVISSDYGICDSATLIRREFPRKRSWNKWFGEGNMSIVHYSMVYEDICSVSRDADDFDVYGQISNAEVEKCEWIVAICDVMNSIITKYVSPVLAEANMEYDWFDFYENYFFE